MTEILNLSRRDLLKTGATAAAGLVLGVHLPDRRPWIAAAAAAATTTFEPNAFLRIDSNGIVTIWVHQSEMGQGVHTALPMLVAEELEADWSTIRVEQADSHPTKYGAQMTGGSSAVRSSWQPLRKVGATGRYMLIQAAAQQWGVDPSSCHARNGEVVHDATGRRLPYGDLAAAAAALPVPEDPPLKDASAFRFIGKRMPRTDTPLKVDGSATFGIDVRVPNMRFATVIRSPVFGGTLTGFDAAAAKRVAGVRDAFKLDAGRVSFNSFIPGFPQAVVLDDRIVVTGDNTWAAFQGAKAVDARWDNSAFSMSSPDITRHHEELCAGEGVVVQTYGDAAAHLAGAAKRIDATYEVPYLAHATMEPMNCTADVRSDRCEIWAPTQDPQSAQLAAAELTGLPVEKITVHVTFLGGGFGRRAEQDFVADAVQASMHAGAPVQVTWTREEDTQHDCYRPSTYNKLSAGIDAGGRPVAWTHRMAGPSIVERFFGVTLPPGQADFAAIEGAANIPYDIPNVHVDSCKSDVPVPVGWWRSVGSSQNAFVTECFIDEVAHAAGVDPYEFRRTLLADHPRHKGVLELAAAKAGWGTPLPEGRARGIAVAESFGSFAAQVAEVSVSGGKVKVHRVTCAVDCGKLVNPDTIEAQMQGAIVYGLTAALKGEITIENGRVRQSNFHDYQPLRMREMPKVDVHIVESTEDPGGIGEPGTPPIAPAVANAVFAATGPSICKLPIGLDGAGTGGSMGWEVG